MTQLRLENVFHAFGSQTVVSDVSFTAEGGAVTCLVGPSGCGKTTLLRIAAGLERLERGRVIVGERVIADADAGIDVPVEERDIGMMFQDYALFPHLTLYQNIIFGVSGRRGDRAAWARKAIEQMGLSEHAGSYPHMLSGGQQARAALLRAMAPEPRVLLLDEPFSGLDVTLRAQIREDTLRFLSDSRVTTLLVTHDPEEAMFMAKRLLVMEKGRILQSATPAETYFRPMNAYVAELFGPINRVSGSVEGGALDTQIGRFEAPGLADGTPVQVLIRPEGILLTLAKQGSTCTSMGTVLSSQLLGPSTLLRLRCRGTEGSRAIELRARVPGVFNPAPGAAVEVQVDRTHAFVFPERPPGSGTLSP